MKPARGLIDYFVDWRDIVADLLRIAALGLVLILLFLGYSIAPPNFIVALEILFWTVVVLLLFGFALAAPFFVFLWLVESTNDHDAWDHYD